MTVLTNLNEIMQYMEQKLIGKRWYVKVGADSGSLRLGIGRAFKLEDAYFTTVICEKRSPNDSMLSIGPNVKRLEELEENQTPSELVLKFKGGLEAKLYAGNQSLILVPYYPTGSCRIYKTTPIKPGGIKLPCEDNFTMEFDKEKY